MSFRDEVEKYAKNNKTMKEIYYDLNSYLKKIPKKQGIYIVKLIDGKEIEINDTTTAIDEYNGRSMLYPKSELEYKLSICDKKYLYIGKADNLHNRIKSLLYYAQKDCKNHRGGRALWQIKDWKDKLSLCWCKVENAREIEEKLLKLHLDERLNAYPGIECRFLYPFANWKG